jgi:sterol desaturase/sphingolipid hydroxylase (fatty acid hydroxylase superfamily)
MLVLCVFLLLTVTTLWAPRRRAEAYTRARADWVLDGAGLLVQGLMVPALGASCIYGVCQIVAPCLQGAFTVSGPVAFGLNFVVVDYLYYWNHRLLHTTRWWPLHAVHHTPKIFDVFITARNTLWTPLAIAYVWANGLGLFLLADSGPFMAAAALTAGLDLWRHTTFGPATGSWAHRLLALVLITPHEHMWHHSHDRTDDNFGANLALWDRLHGTYYRRVEPPTRLGLVLRLPWYQQLVFPFGKTP